MHDFHHTQTHTDDNNFDNDDSGCSHMDKVLGCTCKVLTENKIVPHNMKLIIDPQDD